jgi:HEAT repeat protein
MRKRNVLGLLLCMLFLLIFSSVDNAHSDQVDNLIKNLDSNYRDLRMSSIWTLGKVSDPRAFEALISALKHKDLGVRIAAADALGDRKDPKAFVKALEKITGKDFGQDHDKWEKWWNQNRQTVLKNN